MTNHDDLHRDIGRMEGRLDAMEDSLFLDTGGFSASARPGIGVQPAPDAIFVE